MTVYLVVYNVEYEFMIFDVYLDEAKAQADVDKRNKGTYGNPYAVEAWETRDEMGSNEQE